MDRCGKPDRKRQQHREHAGLQRADQQDREALAGTVRQGGRWQQLDQQEDRYRQHRGEHRTGADRGQRAPGALAPAPRRAALLHQRGDVESGGGTQRDGHRRTLGAADDRNVTS
ncbi:MAG: hypothetical protein NVV68_00300 [Dokdonella sp.]|nr:hypothetical protein [Dokdonella sp.]